MMTNNKTLAASENIQKKLALIELWATKGVPYKKTADGHELFKAGTPVLVDFPTSVDKFRRWGCVEFEIKAQGKVAFDKFFNQPGNKTINELEDVLKRLSLRAATQKNSMDCFLS